MSTPVLAGGSVAAAVLGSGAVAATSGHVGLAAASHGTSFTASRGTALAVAQQLAQTGAPATVVLATVGILLVLAGFLMVGLARRHDTTGQRHLRMPRRIAVPPPRFA